MKDKGIDIKIYNLFDEYRKVKNSVEFSVDDLKNELGKLVEKIVLYGAGSAGIAFLHYLQDVNIWPICFADANPEKWGRKCEGLQIIDYRTIPDVVGADALVIICINTDGIKYCKSFDEALRKGGHKGVHLQLRKCGCENIIDYTFFRRYRELFHGDPYNLPSCSDVRLMEKKESDIAKAYSVLADDESKEIYLKILRFRMIDDTIDIPTIAQDKQYFEYDFFEKSEEEGLVDCGAFNGISLKAFLKEHNNVFKHYYGFEPDISNYKKLETYIEELPYDISNKINIYNQAVFDKNSVQKMYSLEGPGSFLSATGDTKIKTVMIDDVVDPEKVTYIKMNIEGAELKALEGAKKTIQLRTPNLAIAGYHKTWDLWEIPLLVHQMYGGYRIYLRSYMKNLSFIYYVTAF